MSLRFDPESYLRSANAHNGSPDWVNSEQLKRLLGIAKNKSSNGKIQEDDIDRGVDLTLRNSDFPEVYVYLSYSSDDVLNQYNRAAKTVINLFRDRDGFTQSLVYVIYDGDRGPVLKRHFHNYESYSPDIMDDEEKIIDAAVAYVAEDIKQDYLGSSEMVTIQELDYLIGFMENSFPINE